MNHGLELQPPGRKCESLLLCAFARVGWDLDLFPVYACSYLARCIAVCTDIYMYMHVYSCMYMDIQVYTLVYEDNKTKTGSANTVAKPMLECQDALEPNCKCKA